MPSLGQFREQCAGVRVTGPDGVPVEGWWLELGDGTAVVELASCSGITRMRRLDPLGATSRGTGEVMAAALDAGCERLVVAVGGSASTDGGAPVLAALGRRCPPRGGAVVLTDVGIPLLGPEGAARLFGPQKGADEDMVARLERRLETLAAQLGGDPATPGAGAAGGVAFGLLTWGARLVPGAAEVARLTGLTDWVGRGLLVVTGEGRYDAPSQRGKVVGYLLSTFESVAVVAGECAETPPCWHLSLATLAGSREAAMAAPERWLEVAGARIAVALGPGSRG